jgi:AcrR family transcriptional regulator
MDDTPEPGSGGTAGREPKRKGARTRRRLLEAAEHVFADLGYHDASIVKITEAAGVAQGTFYLYFSGKQAIFDVLVEDLNRRLRHAMAVASAGGSTRLEAERLGFEAFFRFTAEHPALYRVIRQAEFVSPKMLRLHYERLAEGYVEGLKDASERGEIAIGDPEVTAWALMAVGEMVGMRWILWGDTREVPPEVFAETMAVVASVLGRRPPAGSPAPENTREPGPGPVGQHTPRAARPGTDDA